MAEKEHKPTSTKRRYERTPEAIAYRRLYKTKAWALLRDRALVRDLYTCQHKGCGVQLTKGRDKPNSAVVHHIKPHKGDHDLFFDLNNLQSVCKMHHDSDIQSIEAGSKSLSIGADGWPDD